MHILEAYKNYCNVEVDKPFVYEHFFPIEHKKFISCHVENYPYFQEVINLILPSLREQGYHIIQFDANSQNVLTGVAGYSREMNVGQKAFLLKRSSLHFGEDSYLFDICSMYDTKGVLMFGHTWPKTTMPYFNKENFDYICADFPVKPTYNPKTSKISEIKPEVIAKKIMQKLGIEFKVDYQTIYIGKNYTPKVKLVELWPTNFTTYNPQETNDKIVCIRMDYNFNQNIMYQFLVMAANRLNIVTNKDLDINVLKRTKDKIRHIDILIDGDISFKFIDNVRSLGISHAFISFKSKEELSRLKAKYFEYGVINDILAVPKEEIKKIIGDGKNLFFKSSKVIHKGKLKYKSIWHVNNNKPISDNESDFSEFINFDDEEIRREFYHYFIVKRT